MSLDKTLKTLCIIPARAGSRRIPWKNIRLFFGKPIITYAIETALQSGLFDEVMVSTDSPVIAEIAIKAGAKVPFLRGAATSGDFAGIMDVLEECVTRYKSELGVEIETGCCIYPTGALTTVKMLRDGELMMREQQDLSYVLPIVPFSAPIQRAFYEVGGRLRMYDPSQYHARSQDLSVAYKDAGQFFWFRPGAVLDRKPVFAEDTAPMILSSFETQDIDHEEDWKLAEVKYQLGLLRGARDRRSEPASLVVGTVQFGTPYGIANSTGQPKEQELQRMAEFCSSAKINKFDTAPDYGNSENVVGKYFVENVQGVQIITKLPCLSHCRDSATGIQAARDSLKASQGRMGEKNLHTVLLHHGGDLATSWGRDLWKEMETWRAQGLVNKIGVSIYSLDELPEWIVLQPPDVIQAPVNFLDHRLSEHPLFSVLLAAGTKVHARSVFLQGLVLPPPEKLSAHFAAALPALTSFHDYCRSAGISPVQAALDYVRAPPWVDSIVLGVETLAQLQENSRYFANPPMELPEFGKCDDVNVLNPFLWPARANS